MITKLYDSFQPENYQLMLDIATDGTKFSGTVEITGNSSAGGNVINLHAKDIDINKILVNGESAQFSSQPFDTLCITASQATLPAELNVFIEFKGIITDAMHGVYPCYFEHEGKKKKLIASQFESHHAREVFPCVDEPAAKATFDLTLVTNENEAVLANTPIKSQTSEKKRLTTGFETTPKMSTYLLAFVTGEMNFKEATTKDGVLVRSWASMAQDPSWLDYSVKEAVDLIEFYNDYFNVPYPLAKCDQVALPDFEVGAMENWGLITYRETVLLTDPKNISLSTQQLISLVVAHELSHQWFGNLVTMQWWDDLWLNESFANMTEYLSVDRLHPEWHMWEEFVAQDVIAATNRDVYSDVQPIRVAVRNPDEIGSLFDPAIVYAKGGKLLKTLHDLLGDDVWRKGLKDYFENNAYGNTSRDDLWKTFSNHTSLDIAALMNQWIEHPGQPLITLDQTKSRVKLEQKRLLLDDKSDAAIWEIPLLSTALPQTFKKPEETIELESDAWVQLNISGVGHYIVNYINPEHKSWLAAQITEGTVESTWKIARLNELLMLARHGDTTLSEALGTIKATSGETRAMVWSLISGIIGTSRQVIEGIEAAENSIKQLTYNLAKPNFEQLGWDYPENEDSNQTHLRTISLGLVLASEEEHVVKQALAQYRASEDPESLPAEIRSLLLGSAVRFGTEAEFKHLIKLYKSTASAEYKSDICGALTSTKTPEHGKQLLTMMLDTTIIRPQDTVRWFVSLMRNRYTKDLTWEWLTSNWPWVIQTFGGSKTYDDFARYSAAFINTPELYEKYRKFFTPKMKDIALKRTIAIGLEEIKARVAWRKRDEASVITWLKEYSAKN